MAIGWEVENEKRDEEREKVAPISIRVFDNFVYFRLWRPKPLAIVCAHAKTQHSHAINNYVSILQTPGFQKAALDLLQVGAPVLMARYASNGFWCGIVCCGMEALSDR